MIDGVNGILPQPKDVYVGLRNFFDIVYEGAFTVLKV